MYSFEDYRPDILRTESGGDYNALFGYQNRPGGRFQNVRVTDMTIGDILEFQNPRGAYGQYVAGARPDQERGVATPVGAYQIVGTTLRDAVRALNLPLDTTFTPDVQDRIAKYIFETQGPRAWQGLNTDETAGQNVARATMAALGRGDAMNGQPAPTGLLAQGAAPQRPRRDIGNILDQLAVGFAGMSLRPNQGIIDLAQSRIEQRQTRQQRNATADWLESQGFGQFAEGVRQGAISASDALTFARGETQDPYSTIGKLQADLAAGRISQEQYNIAIQGMAPQGMTIESTPDGGFRLVQGAGVTSRPLTEQQSKDMVFATRAEGALAALEPVAGALTSFGQRLAGADPTGAVRGAVQTPEFQVAQQAGQEFLQAILRKDTGAAITEQEQRLYGETYLPQPGDGPAVLEQKRLARARAIEALKMGMNPDQLLRLEGRVQEEEGGGQGAGQPSSGTQINGVIVGDPY